jgi:hypothetical protein
MKFSQIEVKGQDQFIGFALSFSKAFFPKYRVKFRKTSVTREVMNRKTKLFRK